MNYLKQLFRIIPKIIQKELMDEIEEDEEFSGITVRRSRQPRFFKQLNSMQNQKWKRSKRKLKQLASISAQKLEKFQQMGVDPRLKSAKRLPEVNRNGNKILATWRNDQIHGQAQIHYNNGVIFKGVYQNGIKIKGHFQFANGYEYIGNCLGNKFNGQGSLIFPSGKIMTGEWKDYALLGKGKIQYPSGEVYYGEIKNLKKDGKGYLYFNDGGKYVGQFKSGLITGSGAYFMNDKPVATGKWLNGELMKSSQLDEVQHNLHSMDFQFADTGPEIIDKILQEKQSNQNILPSSAQIAPDQPEQYFQL